MNKSVLVVLIVRLFLTSEAATVETPADETCLLQTKASVETGRQLDDTWSTDVPEFEINLDIPPEDRFTEVSKKFQKSYIKFYKEQGSDAGTLASMKHASHLRGDETAEFQSEIRGIAEFLGVPEYYVHAQQMGATFLALKGPFLKFMDTMGMVLPSGQEKSGNSPTELLDHFSTSTYGSAGILARAKDGTVWHARNLGFAMPKVSQHMVYNALFTKGGKKLFKAQMAFPSVQVFTATRKGHNGYSYQVNTRYVSDQADSMSLMANLYQKKIPLAAWTARKVLENTDNYEDAVKLFSETPTPGPEYTVLSGVKKGTVLYRDPDSVAYKLDLDDKHPYIVVTNFDSAKGDEREWLQPTRTKGVSSRVRAEKMLEKAKDITPELLQEVLNDKDVTTSNVIYQSLTNVEHGVYKSSLPHCANCE